MADLHMFRVDDDESHWYVAQNAEEAQKMYESDSEREGVTHPHLLKVVQEDDSVLCAAKLQKDRDPFIIAEEFVEEELEGNDKDQIFVKTWKQWADEHGPGFFTSTV